MRMTDTGQQLTTESFGVLNAIVLKKSVALDALAASLGLDESTVRRVTDGLEADGHVVVLDGQAIPDDSAAEVVRRYNAQRWSALRDQPEIERWHERFERVNELMLAAMDAWQQVRVGPGKIPNDHSDADYDNKVIARIDGIIVKVGDLLAQLGKRVERFNRYPIRFEAAMERVESDKRYVSDPRVESVHNIWFEMHEDILLLLGKERVN